MSAVLAVPATATAAERDALVEEFLAACKPLSPEMARMCGVELAPRPRPAHG